MKRCFLGAALASVWFLSSSAFADLNTAEYISADGGGDGKVVGDLTGVGEVTLYDGPGGDFWNGGDQVQLLYDNELKTGDFTATARVVAQTEAVDGRWGKAGVGAFSGLDGMSSSATAQVAAGNGSQIDPPIGGGDHSPVPVRIGGRQQNDGQGGYELPIFDSAGAEITNNVFPPAEANTPNPPINTSWLRIQYRAATNTFVAGYAPDVEGQPGDWGYSNPKSDVPASGDGWYVGLYYSAHNSLDLANVADEDGFHGVTFDNYSFVDEYLLPELKVGGSDLGSLVVGGALSDIVKGEPTEVQGLSQYWFGANMRAMPEAFLEAGDTGTEDYPLVNPNGAFTTTDTWWRGNQGNPVTVNLPQYPSEGLAGTRFDGSADENDYGVRLTGEIFVAANGEWLVRDGIDDFAMIAIDQDGNGELDELDTVSNADVGGGAFGDIIVLDDDWANADGSSQPNTGFADFENIPADGEWRKVEIWMSEGGGGDAGIIYAGSADDPDIFDELSEAAPTLAQRDKFLIPGDALRSIAEPIVGATATASLRDDVEYILQVGTGGGDQISVGDNDGLYTTVLDVTGATVRVTAEEGLADGTEWTLFAADSLLGTDGVNFLFDDAAAWDLSRISEGIIVFGTASLCDPNTGGDLNGDGTVSFPDFLILSSNFGNAVASHALGDINCDGVVSFPDFLILSSNFGNAVGAEANAVPEPSSLALIGFGSLLMGLVRRRRR